jgi:signal transduction histidine kinase
MIVESASPSAVRPARGGATLPWTTMSAAIAAPTYRGAVRQPRLWLVALIAAVGCAVPLRSVAVALTTDDVDPVQVALLDWITIPFILAGLVAWLRRPGSRLGLLMIAGGFASGLSALQLTHVDSLFTIGAAFDLLPAAFFLHVILAFPNGHLRSRFERLLVVGAYGSAIGLQLVKMLLGAFGPRDLLELWPSPGASAYVQHVQLFSLSAICLAGVGVLVARRQLEGRSRRRSLALLIDLFAIGLVMIAVLFVDGDLNGPAFQPIQRATLVVIGLSPIVFLVGLLDARLARSAVGDLMIELRANPAHADLRNALARALRDPSLTLAYWLPDFQAYVDPDGREIELPEGEGRAAMLIDRDGRRVAALIHDSAIADEPELLDAVAAAAAMALDNVRLQAELRARVEELRGSRARVIDAGQKERQRLERNLHDGAQQRLIALSLGLSLLKGNLIDDAGTRARLDEARRQIALSLEELRAVARGMHPAVLSGHGLEVALESLAAQAAIPVRLTVEIEGRLPERVEVAAYYVVSESLTNIARHARATEATVAVDPASGGVVVEIVDNGVGGADTEGGSGLRGLADRVEALGGRLRVWTPRGGGTRVQAEIPCA